MQRRGQVNGVKNSWVIKFRFLGGWEIADAQPLVALFLAVPDTLETWDP